MTYGSRDELNKLHQHRARLADMESEMADTKKFVRVGGLWWRLLGWLEGWARSARKDVEDELRSLGYPVQGGDE
jgi:hypothetical protein